MLSSIFLTLYSFQANFAIIIEDASHCSIDSKIRMNYTYTKDTRKGVGYCEFLEKIEATSNVQVRFSFNINTWLKRVLQARLFRIHFR